MFVNAMNLIQALRDREDGQTLAEYALILALISVALVATLIAVEGGIGAALDAVVSALTSA